jgi:hypothetical protein
VPLPPSVVPLTSSQVDAASRLHSRLKQWSATDSALEALGRVFPGFDLAASLLKVSALNQLYGTNVYAVFRMAEHVGRVMAGSLSDGLVERIAALPARDGLGAKRVHISFASKFAHFFVDADRFPIYDGYAVSSLSRHVERGRAGRPTYGEYTAAHRGLRERGGLDCTGRQLDRYLWLEGLYDVWRKDSDAKINVEVKALFASADKGVQRDVVSMRVR